MLLGPAGPVPEPSRCLQAVGSKSCHIFAHVLYPGGSKTSFAYSKARHVANYLSSITCVVTSQLPASSWQALRQQVILPRSHAYHGVGVNKGCQGACALSSLSAERADVPPLHIVCRQVAACNIDRCGFQGGAVLTDSCHSESCHVACQLTCGMHVSSATRSRLD